MPRLVNIQAMIDRAIEARSQVRGGLRDNSTFSVSDAGTCYRKRIFKRLGVEPIVPIPTASLRKMLAGDAGHDMLQGLLRVSGDLFASEQEIGTSDIKGHHDGIVKIGHTKEKVLLEFKTVEKWTMSHITGACSCAGAQAHPIGPKPEHEIQMFTYWGFLRKDYKGLDQACLVYLKREDFGSKQFDYLWVPDIAERVAREWKPLLHYWRMRQLPPCTCDQDYGGAGRSYCRYKNEDGTACCDPSLMANLTGTGLGGKSNETKKRERSRQQQVDTIRERFGNDHFEKIGAMSSSFKDKGLAQRASWKHWYPDRFDDNGELFSEWEGKLNVNSDN